MGREIRTFFLQFCSQRLNLQESFVCGFFEDLGVALGASDLGFEGDLHLYLFGNKVIVFAGFLGDSLKDRSNHFGCWDLKHGGEC